MCKKIKPAILILTINCLTISLSKNSFRIENSVNLIKNCVYGRFLSLVKQGKRIFNQHSFVGNFTDIHAIWLI